MGSNQRRHPRVDTDLPVRVRSADGTQDGNLRNVSATGAAIEFSADLGRSSVAFDIGDSIEMKDEGPLAVRGTVVRAYDGGVAMHFDGPEETLLAHIAAIARNTHDRD